MRQRFRSLVTGMVLSAAFCGSAMTPEPRRALEMPAEANSASTPEQLREREKTQIAGLKYADNRTVFSDTGCYIRYNAMGGTFAFADLAVAHRDALDHPLFNQFDILALWDAERIAALFDGRGSTLANVREYQKLGFSGMDIAMYVNNCGRLAEAQDERKKGTAPEDIARARQLRISPEGMTPRDTKKPNTVMVFPTTDHNHAFDNQQVRAFYQSLTKAYDVWAYVTATDRNLYAQLDMVPSIDALVIGGHGTSTTLLLGEDGPHRCAGNKATYTLDTGDQEFAQHLLNLTNHARIFLFSCTNGEGGAQADNLSNFVSAAACGRTVYSGTTLFSIEAVTLIHTQPLLIQINEGETSILYTASGGR